MNELIAKSLVLGIDEAGRGPGLGPMVLAAVALDEKGEAGLMAAGVRDSKAFGSSATSRKTRARLAALIGQQAIWTAVEICEVADIDAHVAQGRLNHLERERARLLIRRAPACTRVVADGHNLFSSLAAEFPNFEACDRADATHIAVAAASICAKALRDELFEAIATRYEPAFGTLRGGGYVNPATCAFVAEYQRRHGCLPPEARKSWPWRGIPRSPEEEVFTSPLSSPRVR
jgi:ribonuclease HII